MRVLAAFECSGVVRRAFRGLGHEAYSCDLKPAEDSSVFHFQQDVFEILDDDYWDLVIAHPPCQYLAHSGVRWLDTEEGRWNKMIAATEVFNRVLRSKTKRLCVENPKQHGQAIKRISRSYSQVVHPWWFGHTAVKPTHLWLINLKPLVPTNLVGPPPTNRKALRNWQHVYRLRISDDRAANRARTFPGFADAMALQRGIQHGQVETGAGANVNA